MSKHLRMIATTSGGPRREFKVESGNPFEQFQAPFQVFHALYGDGTERYQDVSKVMNGVWPTWPDNWEELVYGSSGTTVPVLDSGVDTVPDAHGGQGEPALTIHTATYGLGVPTDYDVTAMVRSFVRDNQLDFQVTNDVLNLSNPFKGKKKELTVTYSYGDGPPVEVTRNEREFLIVGKGQYEADGLPRVGEFTFPKPENGFPLLREGAVVQLGEPYGNELYKVKIEPVGPMAADDLNKFLVNKFQVSPHRLRAPMPIEVREFHRNDLAKLFHELGFAKGAEIGVAEGNYSEVLLKANPDLHLLLVDPWTKYSDNPRAHSQEHQDYSLAETRRKTAPYPNVTIYQGYSMDAVKQVPGGSLDFAYVDGHHSYQYVKDDLTEWSKRVRSGGIVSGDDYYAMRWGGVVEAVQEYVKEQGIAIWYIFTGHKSVDFMWIKP